MIDANDARKIAWSVKYQRVINEIDMAITTAAGVGKHKIEYVLPKEYCEDDCRELHGYLKDEKGYYIERDSSRKCIIVW